MAAAHNIPVIDEFGDALDEFARCPGCTDEDKQRSVKVADDLKHVGGYYQYIGTNNSRLIGHNAGMFIVQCHSLHLKGFNLATEDCNVIVTITPLSTPDYFNCYQLSLDRAKNPDNFYLGISLVLFIDNFPSMSVPTEFSVDKSLGVRVSVDSPNSVPFNKVDTIAVPPGRWSHVEVTQEVRERLREPYGSCADDVTLVNSHGVSKTYTMRACISICVEDHILSECNCLDASMMNLLTEFRAASTIGMKYCEDVTQSNSQFFSNVDCAERVRAKVLKTCSTNCSFSCDEIIYETSTSQAGWPKSYDMPSFYRNFIKYRPYQAQFVDESEWAMKPQTELVKDNFVRLSVYHGDYRYKNFNQSAAITTSNFLSRLGGALNLWSGITIILFMEIVDLVYQFVSIKLFSGDKQLSHGITKVG